VNFSLNIFFIKKRNLLSFFSLYISKIIYVTIFNLKESSYENFNPSFPSFGKWILTFFFFGNWSTIRSRSFSPLPIFKSFSSFPYYRLTHDEFIFSWNLSPLQSSNFSFEYSLLPPRSALKENQKKEYLLNCQRSLFLSFVFSFKSSYTKKLYGTKYSLVKYKFE